MNAVRIGLAVTVLIGASTVILGGDEDNLPEEMKVVAQWAGTWDMVVNYEAPGGKPRLETGTGKGEWLLNRRLLQFKYKYSDGSEGLGLLTYDMERRAYRYWVFHTAGGITELSGQWDQASKTMTWTARNGLWDETTELKCHFPNKETQEWTLIVKNRAGIMDKQTGKLTLHRGAP